MERKRVPLGNYITEYSVRNRSGEDIPVYSVTNSQGFCTEYFDKEVASKDKTTYKIVPRGYFAYNPSRINVGSVDWQRCEGRVIVSPLYNVFSVSEKMEQQYLFYFLKSNVGRQMIKAKASGSVRDNLKMDMLKEMTIPERTIEEQKKCVATLDALKTIISLWEKELEKLDELIKARFVELFGNPEQNEKGWRTCRLGDECTVINGRAYKAEELLDEGKYRVLRVGNFFTNDSWYYSDLELDNDKYCDEGDLLFAWSASFGPRIWHGEKVIYHYHIWKLIGYENCLNKDFFVELLNYNCDVMKRGTHGSTMLHFTKSQMEDQLLILPPMQLQEQFADFVHQVDKSKVVVQNELNKAQLLFDSLMQSYFG